MITSRAVFVSVLLAMLSLGQSLRAEASLGPVPEEAKRRWKLAFQLAEEKNHAAAVAELRVVYELRPTGQVLHFLGLQLAAWGKPAEAVEALEKALLDEGSLGEEDRRGARLVLEEQRKRVGMIKIRSNVEGALVVIDGVPTEAKTPLAKAIPVASGEHLVEVDATALGYRPMRKKVSVAGLSEAEAVFELVPGGFARLRVDVKPAGVDVYIDGEFSGKAPRAEALKLVPGVYVIELRRPGYRVFKKEVKLDMGDMESIQAELEEDAGWIAVHGGWLELEASEKPVDVWVDGKARGIYRDGGMRLSPGVHWIRVERGGFRAVEREVEVRAGERVKVRVRLEPMAETLEKYLDGVRWRRNWGIGVLGLGVVGVAGGVAALNIYGAQLSADKNSSSANRSDNDKNSMLVSGIVAGAGFVAMGVGVWLILANQDPERYNPKLTEHPLSRLRILPMAGMAGDSHGLTMGFRGEF